LPGDDRFRMMFYEEARELLIGLEEGLVELERRQGDRAHLDRTFRAAHSLKGAAAMVGLPAIAGFTHGIEAVLDRVRSGALPVDPDMITTLLEARDHLAAMVEADSNNAPTPDPAGLSDRLAALLLDAGAGAPRPAPVPVPATPPPEPPRPEPAAAKTKAAPRARNPTAGAARVRAPRSKPKKAAPPSGVVVDLSDDEVDAVSAYRITLKPGADVLRRGVDPLGVLDELRELGTTRVTTDPGLVPTLDELDPERCYFVWQIEVETDAPPERLDDVFLFLAGDSVVTIERPTAPGGAAARPAAPAAPARPFPAADDVPRPLPPRAPGGAAEVPARVTQVSMPAPAFAPPRVAPRIRVDANQLDDLVGLAGELAVLSDNLQGLRDVSGASPWCHTLEALERVSRQVRDTTLDLRMVPVDELFSRFPRVVRDLADRYGKEIELRIVGQETRLDRTIVEKLSDPMIHLIRNAVDHALESPEARVARGKPRKGQIRLSAGHEGDRVAIRVEDDGRGLDREAIVRKGIALGLVPVGTSSDDPRVDSLIFEAGFSTRDKVSDLSGRGVGLDVVRDAVRALRGSLAVESTPGQGTSFVFRLPLTLALIDGLLVEAAGSRYVVPLAQVEECVALSGARPALSRGRPCVSVRGELVPMVPLRKVFRAEGDPPERQELLLTRHAGQRVGVTVDKLLGRVQAVIQALGEGLAGLNRFSGATILGDGSVSLILDLAALVSESRAADNHAQNSNHHHPHTDTHNTPAGGPRAEGFR